MRPHCRQSYLSEHSNDDSTCLIKVEQRDASLFDDDQDRPLRGERP